MTPRREHYSTTGFIFLLWSVASSSFSSCQDTTPVSEENVQTSNVTCVLRNAPRATSSLATQIVTLPNGTVVEDPDENLPFGTIIKYTCADRYVLEDPSGNSDDGIPVNICTEDGSWSGSTVTCAIDLGFQIALGMAITSGLIILIVSALFIGSYCLKAERKAKARKHEDEANPEHSYDKGTFEVA